MAPWRVLLPLPPLCPAAAVVPCLLPWRSTPNHGPPRAGRLLPAGRLSSRCCTPCMPLPHRLQFPERVNTFLISSASGPVREIVAGALAGKLYTYKELSKVALGGAIACIADTEQDTRGA